MSEQELTHQLIDIETLGVRNNCVVLSLACVAFKLEDSQMSVEKALDNSFYVKLSAPEQIKLGRKVEKPTVDWWKQQSPEARKILDVTKEDVKLKPALTAFNDFMKSVNSESDKMGFIWSRGNNFDFPIITSLFHQVDMEPAWNTWRFRDVRTMIDVLTGSMNGYFKFNDPRLDELIKHNALHDAIRDVIMMQKVFSMVMDLNSDEELS